MNINFPNKVLYPIPKPEVKGIDYFCTGMIFKDVSLGQHSELFTPEYSILSQTDYCKVCLISLENGSNRWSDPVEVNKTNYITKDEMNQVCCLDEFEYIGMADDGLFIGG